MLGCMVGRMLLPLSSYITIATASHLQLPIHITAQRLPVSCRHSIALFVQPPIALHHLECTNGAATCMMEAKLTSAILIVCLHLALANKASLTKSISPVPVSAQQGLVDH